MNNCIFCKIVKGEIEAKKIYENDASIGILDVNPLTQGHCLIISKRHVQWFYELENDEFEKVFRAVKIVAKKIKDVLNPEVVCMIVRGLRIPHVHIILIPSFKEDIVGRFFALLDAVQSFPPSTKEDIENKLLKLKDAIQNFSQENLKKEMDKIAVLLRIDD